MVLCVSVGIFSSRSSLWSKIIKHVNFSPVMGPFGSENSQASFLAQRRTVRMTSACTGAYTAEMAMAVLLNIIEQSDRVEQTPVMKSRACWDSYFHIIQRFAIFPAQSTALQNLISKGISCIFCSQKYDILRKQIYIYILGLAKQFRRSAKLVSSSFTTITFGSTNARTTQIFPVCLTTCSIWCSPPLI